MEIYEPVIKYFENIGIPAELYWVGPVEGAEMQNGILFENGEWTVYYREKGIILNREVFDSRDRAVSALETRLRRLINYYNSIQ